MYSRPFSSLGTAEVFFFLRTTRLRIVGVSDEISTKRIAYGVNDLSHLVLLIIFKTLNVLMTVDA